MLYLNNLNKENRELIEVHEFLNITYNQIKRNGERDTMIELVNKFADIYNNIIIKFTCYEITNMLKYNVSYEEINKGIGSNIDMCNAIYENMTNYNN